MALHLSGASQKLQMITSAAGTVRVHASYTTVPTPITTTSNISPGATIGAAISTAATTDIIPAPGASNVTNVKNLVIANQSGSVNQTITVQATDGAQTDILWSGEVAWGEQLVMDEVGAWTVYLSDGSIKPASGLKRVTLNKSTTYPQPVSATDTLDMYARLRAGMMQLKTMNPAGVDSVLQAKLSENGFSCYMPNNGTTIGLNLGIAWTSGGTVSHPTPSSSAPAQINQQKRTRWANIVTTTNQVLGLRVGAAEKRYWRGNAAGLGGFRFHARFQIGLWPAATVRLFVGLNDSTSGWVISDTLTGNGCGFWHDTTEAASVLTFVTRNGTTATKSAGIPLTTNLAAGQGFDAWIYSPPNGSYIGYCLIDQANGNVLVDTTTTTTIPLSTSFMGPELAMSNGTANITVTTTAFELSGHSVESDN